jgi:ketosteroid isomerase-like protein
MGQRTNDACGPSELYTALVGALETKDADGYANLFAPEGRLELPFRRPGIPAAWPSREEIRHAAKTGWAAVPLRLDDVRNLRLHETTDPEVIVGEHDLVGVGTDNDRPFTFPFVWVLQARDGQVAVLREYLNVISVALATDRLGDLAASLEAATGDGASSSRLACAASPVVEPPTGEGEPGAVFARFQRAVLDISPDGIADLFAPEGILEYGFTVPGMPQRLEGREAVRASLRRLLGRFRFEEYRNVRIHQAVDPEVIVVEHDIAGTVVATGRPHVMSYIYVLRARDGQVVHLRDYPNLLAAAETSGGLASLLDRFSPRPPDRPR